MRATPKVTHDRRDELPLRTGVGVDPAGGGRRRDDLGWSYEQPLPDAVAITGLVAFWDERVDVFLDGERRARPGGAISEALRVEFGV